MNNECNGIIFSDFCLALLTVESVPRGWIYREGFTRSRKLLLLQWLLCGSILLWGYKCVLLSSLVPIKYERTIDTLYELDNSNLRLVIADIAYAGFKKDTRPVMKRVLNKSDAFPYTGGKSPQWVSDRQIRIYSIPP